jgi:ABC-type polysaccharide/polyol phosphate transport system ATPase subunit
MAPVISLQDVGIRFTAPRHSRAGRTPRLFAVRRSVLWGIRHVTLEVQEGEVLGLIGPNGAGKTTLLRTVGGIYSPDEGRTQVRGRVGALLSVTGGLMPQLSGWENIALLGILMGLSRQRLRAVTPKIAEFSGLGDFLDAEVRTYSAGMKARLGFSVAAFVDPDVLLIDEVLAVGDQEFRDRSTTVMNEFANSGRSILIASHDLDRMTAMCSRVVRMERGAVAEVGDPQSVTAHYRGRPTGTPPDLGTSGGRAAQHPS